MCPAAGRSGGRHRPSADRPVGRRALRPWSVLVVAGAALTVWSLTVWSSIGAPPLESGAAAPVERGTAPALSVPSASVTPSGSAFVPDQPAPATPPAADSTLSTAGDVGGGGGAAAGAVAGATAESAGSRSGAVPGFPVAVVLGEPGTPIPVQPIGVSADGVLTPPTDPSRVGWWVAGPRPGEPGRAVIAGHVDSPAGLGAFAALDGVQPGAVVRVVTADGVTLRYTVVDRREVRKSSLDPAMLTRDDGVADLLLVTCIGEFDRRTLSYRSNLLITAEPVAG